jgi:hypothetical protein
MGDGDAFCAKCGARNNPNANNPNGIATPPPMYKTCPKCQTKIGTGEKVCPYCNFEFVNPNVASTNGLSTKKILSLAALALAAGGIFLGFIVFEIAAFVVSIVALIVGDKKEKDAKIYAIVALLVSIAVIIFSILSFLFVYFASGFFINGYLKSIFDFVNSL